MKPRPKSAATDALQGMLGYELRRASVAAMAALADALEPLGLPPSEASMLMVIGENPGCTQSEVGRSLRVQPANIVPIVSKLARSGSLERVPASGRSVSLFLTGQGNVLFAQIKQIFARHEAKISEPLSDEAREQLILTLRSICDAACRAKSP